MNGARSTHTAGVGVRLPAEIRWHGRGGQGVVTASRLLATGALEAGYYPQSLPDFGAERSGAPVAAYTRIDAKPPVIRGPVTEPHAVIVLDSTLVGQVPLLDGVAPGGVAVLNSALAPAEATHLLNAMWVSVWTVDGDGISERHLGRRMPNVAVLGGLIRAFPVVEVGALADAIQGFMSQAFPEPVVQANLQALRDGYETVRRE